MEVIEKGAFVLKGKVVVGIGDGPFVADGSIGDAVNGLDVGCLGATVGATLGGTTGAVEGAFVVGLTVVGDGVSTTTITGLSEGGSVGGTTVGAVEGAFVVGLTVGDFVSGGSVGGTTGAFDGTTGAFEGAFVGLTVGEFVSGGSFRGEESEFSSTQNVSTCFFWNAAPSKICSSSRNPRKYPPWSAFKPSP